MIIPNNCRCANDGFAFNITYCTWTTNCWINELSSLPTIWKSPPSLKRWGYYIMHCSFYLNRIPIVMILLQLVIKEWNMWIRYLCFWNGSFYYFTILGFKHNMEVLCPNLKFNTWFYTYAMQKYNCFPELIV